MRQTDHFSREELERWVEFAGEGTAFSAAQTAHAAECAACRHELRTLLLTKRPVASDLFAEEEDEFAACLQQAEALRYVHGRADALETETIDFHLEECAACRTLVSTLQAFAAEVERQPLPTLAAQGIGIGTQIRQTWERGGSWLRQLGAQTAAALEAVRPAPMAFGFATQKRENVRQALEFSEPEISGSWRAEGDSRLLHLEHGSCKPGTMVLVEAADEQEQVSWRSFAVFRQGMRRSVLDIEADARADLRTLHVGLLQVAQLNSLIAAELPAAFHAQIAKDPASRTAWELWAQQASAATADIEVRTAAEAVLSALALE